jgi:hypothetical protein
MTPGVTGNFFSEIKVGLKGLKTASWQEDLDTQTKLEGVGQRLTYGLHPNSSHPQI